MGGRGFEVVPGEWVQVEGSDGWREVEVSVVNLHI